MINNFDLHSIHSIIWWLTLSTSIIGSTLIHKRISKRTLGHSMFVHSILLQVVHHVCQSCLSSWFSSFLLDLVHLIKIFLSGWIKLVAKSILCLKWSCLWLWYLINLETTTHCRVHDNLSWSLNLLKAVQCDVIQITCAVEVSLLVSHYLFE